MALVLPFRPPNMPRRDVIAFCERLLVRAKAGEVQGVVCILAVANAQDEITLCGEFAENLAYAASAARAGLDCFATQENDDLEALSAALRDEDDDQWKRRG